MSSCLEIINNIEKNILSKKVDRNPFVGEAEHNIEIGQNYCPDNDVTLYLGDTLELISQIPDGAAQLIVTSPPYNIGKEYEIKMKLEDYINLQKKVINKCVRILSDTGSICWEVGNYIENGEVFPLDILLYPIFKKNKLQLRNRIIWHFEHGLNPQKRLSGRHETILWFTKSDDYFFNLDPIRVPQKYPGKKYYKGPKKGDYSSNPMGKNPGDVWVIPNVKHNHPEKTIHPCQYPVELIERLVLSLTQEGDLVFDPFIGVGSTAVASIIHNRKSAGADLVNKYIETARERIRLASRNQLPLRPMNKPIYEPPKNSTLTKNPF
jgi:adenine-specific DNA-methyltransferase